MSDGTHTTGKSRRLGAALWAGALTAGLLAAVQLVVDRPMLLAERFVPGAGWAEILLLGIYAGAVAWLMSDPKRSARIRLVVWTLFSAVFFAQLALGLAGVDQCLMTGRLHLPVPAMILAGPLFRGHLSFMVHLLAVALLLVGPGWCSHLCYLGAWDGLAAQGRRRPAPLPRWRRAAQVVILALVAASALTLGQLGMPSEVAAAAGLGFGMLGVVVMLGWSRRTGVMAHCVVYCPIGLISTLLGKVSPFRIRIAQECDGCGVCRKVCRYDALSPEDIERRKPALSCTLCGDCVGTCTSGQLGYWLPGIGPEAARRAFIVLAVTLHAACIGLARI